jgi:peptidoglycan/xylan/chitin deacetylase (PgdA/CDA1 family)
VNVNGLWERVVGRYQRAMSDTFYCRRVPMLNRAPLVSFTFDDFPRSAAHAGGAILRAHGARGTYYTALGLMGRGESPVGELFTLDDLLQVVKEGHELGCHTFAHRDAWATAPRAFERDVLDNRRALARLLPRATFPSLSYPINCPRPHTKRRVAKHFACARGGGQRHNAATVSPTCVSAYFIEQARGDVDAMKRLIDANARDQGWLVFATHDVAETPTRFGCTPAVFEAVVRHAAASGARLLPVGEAWREVRGAGTNS